uniref:Trichome birefringence-like N-terminal domain-containing protein n=1 Tax=Cannabis sativa TaxID=3483 RepID=A0A803QLX9_CANSA
MGKMVPFLFISLTIVIILSFFPMRPNPFKVISKQGLISSVQNLHGVVDQEKLPKTQFVNVEEEENCDLFTGHWVPEPSGSLYTNLSCKTIPESKNCFKNGRQDVNFLNWKWKPENCELPRFDAKAFLEMVRGKKMAFIGDSLARNHVESLLCLLSQEEIPLEIYKDSEDRFKKWYFTSHDFTLMIIWSKFLIEANEIMVNGTSSGTYNLHLDKVTSKQGLTSVQNLHELQGNFPKTDHFEEVENCNLFTGHWIPELKGSVYTNSSCTTIPDSKNCFKHGRQDVDFVNWRWKPEKCELPMFDSMVFMEMVRGKKMAFIGDSVARNHIESLLCLLSQEKRMVNGTGTSAFDLQLDKVENSWADFLPELDYAIISDGHWFFRVMYLHQGNSLTGCVYCNEPNITKHDISFAVRMAFRTAFDHINACKNCNGLVTLVRTFAPAHFENGFWNTGGPVDHWSHFLMAVMRKELGIFS